MAILKWPSRISGWAAGRLDLAVMATAFAVFGVSLIFQPARWGSTPAYHLLLLIFRAQEWGALFLLSGVVMGLAAWQFEHRRWTVTAALTIALSLTTGWMMAFIVRYASSPNTTPETWVSWAVFDFLLLKVSASLDHPPPARSQQITDYRQAVDDALTGAAADQKATLSRALDDEAAKLRDAVSAACAAYGQALHSIIPAGALPAGAQAQQALQEARNALRRAEEAYARATGQHARDLP